MIYALLLFSLALSVDGFGVGLSYGMQKIKIGRLSFLVICLSSAVAVTISMLIGNLAVFLLPSDRVQQFGAIMLIIVGSWLFIQNLTLNLFPSKKVFEFKTPNLRIVVNILKEPEQADFDRSGVIDIREAFFLGFALAMDAFGAGFAAALSGFDPFITPVFVAAAKLILVSAGLWIGKHYVVDKVKGKVTLIPGCIIIALGVLNFMRL